MIEIRELLDSTMKHFLSPKRICRNFFLSIDDTFDYCKTSDAFTVFIRTRNCLFSIRIYIINSISNLMEREVGMFTVRTLIQYTNHALLFCCCLSICFCNTSCCFNVFTSLIIPSQSSIEYQIISCFTEDKGLVNNIIYVC